MIRYAPRRMQESREHVIAVMREMLSMLYANANEKVCPARKETQACHEWQVVSAQTKEESGREPPLVFVSYWSLEYSR